MTLSYIPPSAFCWRKAGQILIEVSLLSISFAKLFPFVLFVVAYSPVMRFNPAYLFVLGFIPATLCVTLNVRPDMRSYVGLVETPEARAFHQDDGIHLLAASAAHQNVVHVQFISGVEGNAEPPPKVLHLVTELFMAWLGKPLINPEFVNQLSEVPQNGELSFRFWGFGSESCKERSDRCVVIIGAVEERNQWISIHKGARFLYSTTAESLAAEPLA
ncbi:hypothetical protein F5050DRAFT_1809447 [Lentinula boryana]|uniref:Uncharacterized protein n=1 Tax=Lentinula boryana TaxID=40481 RepID=A0ABQ8Q7Z6_9AGAR|nr:hypothetical protein F5050DRAFT_1809447 [Lentinula boryana]